jgi:hypothetical protein
VEPLAAEAAKAARFNKQLVPRRVGADLDRGDFIFAKGHLPGWLFEQSEFNSVAPWQDITDRAPGNWLAGVDLRYIKFMAKEPWFPPNDFL